MWQQIGIVKFGLGVSVNKFLMPLHDLFLIADSAYYVRHMLREIEIFVNSNTQQFRAVN